MQIERRVHEAANARQIAKLIDQPPVIRIGVASDDLGATSFVVWVDPIGELACSLLRGVERQDHVWAGGALWVDEILGRKCIQHGGRKRHPEVAIFDGLIDLLHNPRSYRIGEYCAIAKRTRTEFLPT